MYIVLSQLPNASSHFILPPAGEQNNVAVVGARTDPIHHGEANLLLGENLEMPAKSQQPSAPTWVYSSLSP